MFHVFAIVEKVLELFYEKGEDKNGVLSYGIYRRNRRNCGKKSRFIAEVFPVSNEEEAFAHLEEIRKKTLGCQTSLLGICNRKKSGGRENER